jgi:hypothetical protein
MTGDPYVDFGLRCAVIGGGFIVLGIGVFVLGFVLLILFNRFC